MTKRQTEMKLYDVKRYITQKLRCHIMPQTTIQDGGSLAHVQEQRVQLEQAVELEKIVS